QLWRSNLTFKIWNRSRVIKGHQTMTSGGTLATIVSLLLQWLFCINACESHLTVGPTKEHFRDNN
ncbi:unnamed protein product, partial [Musa banksii]